MKRLWTAAVVKRSLDAHSAIGLVVGALMYLICLTGALATLAETFERWEQPGIDEFTDFTPQATANALSNFEKLSYNSVESLWFVFPTKAFPRMHISDGEREWYVNADGTISDRVHAPWTEMLRALHVRLLLPENIGFILVSSIGVMLLALILSGIAAHPRVFKDAFTLRLGRNRRLEQADLHNRLSVWALPFHVMIAFTGAFYGLVGILVFSAAALFFDGDHDAVFEQVYGADPTFDADIATPNVDKALGELRNQHPSVTPIYLVIHHHRTRAQFIEIAATVSGRLAYSEIFRFSANGEYFNNQKLTSGPLARQFLYSLYRVHFGYFGPYATRLLWFGLGLALTVVCVTGINVWLRRRGYSSWVNHAWTGLIWGSPLALTTAAIASLLASINPIATSGITLALAIVWSILIEHETRSASHLKLMLGAALVTLGVVHTLLFDFTFSNTSVAWINIAIVTAGIISIVNSYLGLKRVA